MADGATAHDGTRAMRDSARRWDRAQNQVVLPASDEMREFRCPRCDKLLFKGRLMPGSTVETKCRDSFCRKHDVTPRFSVV